MAAVHAVLLATTASATAASCVWSGRGPRVGAAALGVVGPVEDVGTRVAVAVDGAVGLDRGRVAVAVGGAVGVVRRAMLLTERGVAVGGTEVYVGSGDGGEAMPAGVAVIRAGAPPCRIVWRPSR
jgi:hypothetical protein